MGGGGSLINMRAFDWKAGQTIMVALLVMIGSFYTGTLFSNTDSSSPLYTLQQDPQQEQQQAVSSNPNSSQTPSG